MASFMDILTPMQQRQQMPATPLPFIQGMPPAQVQQLPQVGPVDIAPQQLTPAPQAPQDAVPTQGQVSPEEMEQRKQSWKAVLDGFMAQPNAKELMMLVGMKLMQGRRPGQSVGSQFAEAAGTGMAANAMYKQNQVADADKQRKQGMEDQKHELDVRKGTAQADQAEAENDFYAKTRPQAIEEINLGIENLKTKGKFEEARLVEQEFQNGNLREAWELSKQDKRSAIWARKAQVDIQRKNADKVPSAQQALADRLALLKTAFRIEPGESPEDYESRMAQMAVGLSTSSKTNRAADLIKLADAQTDDDKRNALLAEAEGIIRDSTTPQATVRAPATGRGGTSSAIMTFPSIDAYNKAAAEGKIKDGTRVSVNGRLATHKAK